MPWKSQLEQYEEEILKLYEKGYSAKAIRDWLKEKHSINVHKNTVRNFISKRRPLRHHGETKRIMYKLGLLPRPIVYPKRPFDRPSELPYYCGFSEDYNTKRHGYQVLMGSGSTHPSFIALSMKLFRPYGIIILQPSLNKTFTVYELHIVTLLHESFDFLVEYKEDRANFLESLNRGEKWRYVSGLIDSEGSLNVLLNKSKEYYYPAVYIQHTKFEIIRWLKENFGGNYYKRKNYRDKLSHYAHDYWVWAIYGRGAINMLKKLELRHAEKMKQRSIILENMNNLKTAKQLLRQYKQLIEREKANFQLFLRKLAKSNKTIRFHPPPLKPSFSF